jgi:hypothetical protein
MLIHLLNSLGEWAKELTKLPVLISYKCVPWVLMMQILLLAVRDCLDDEVQQAIIIVSRVYKGFVLGKFVNQIRKSTLLM